VVKAIKSGDVVRLRSDGPPMTVKSIAGDIVICEWFDDEREPHERRFSARSLICGVSPAQPVSTLAGVREQEEAEAQYRAECAKAGVEIVSREVDAKTGDIILHCRAVSTEPTL
jgi:uncharacterized protein YodC (DUF2158 family)